MPEILIPSTTVQFPAPPSSESYALGARVSFTTSEGEYTGLITRIDGDMLTVYVEDAVYTYEVPPLEPEPEPERLSRWRWLMNGGRRGSR